MTSTLSEPDTLIFKKNDGDNSIELYDIIIGNKKKKISFTAEDYQINPAQEGNVAAANDATDSEEIVCCLLTEDAIRLTQIGIEIEKYYGSPREIEWAIQGGRIYMLQTRPVSIIESAENDYEVMHELDGPFRSEEDYFSTANIGETLPGSLTWLDSSFFLTCSDLAFQKKSSAGRRKSKKSEESYCPLFRKSTVSICNHATFGLLDMAFYGPTCRSGSRLAQAAMIGVFGRCLPEEEIKEIAQVVCERFGKDGAWSKLNELFQVFRTMSNTEAELDRIKDKYKNYYIPIFSESSAQQTYDAIGRRLTDICEPTSCHLDCSLTCSVYNITLLSELAEVNKGWSSEVYANFARLVSPCLKGKQLDIAAQVENLGATIARCIYHKEFHEWESEVALDWLQTTTSPANEKFLEFLEMHGHRCVREYEIHSVPWESDPLILVKILQAMLKDDMEERSICCGAMNNNKKGTVNNHFLDQLTKGSSFSHKKRRTLKGLVPKCRKAFCLREESKSVLLRVINGFRRAYCHLANKMVEENRLPDEELIFFLTHEEIGLLLRTRASRLIAKALHRQRLYPSMDSFHYAQIIKGIPKPIQPTNEENEDPSAEPEWRKGIPVSTGVADGRARVIKSESDINQIQRGEVLITRSIDTGWTLCFPLLAALITEVGGPLSHGSVMAREYGLPSVFGVPHATLFFQTGEEIMVDGNTGRVTKLTPT